MIALSQCVYCGRDLKSGEVELDHVIPLCRGGADVARNKAACCVPCNRLKGPLTAREFLATRDDPDDLAALIRDVLREVRAGTFPPLPPVPPVPPPVHRRIQTSPSPKPGESGNDFYSRVERQQQTFAQHQAKEREEMQRARAMIKRGECVAELGFTCHCPVCDPGYEAQQSKRLTQDLKDLAALRFAEEVTSKEIRG